MGKKSGVHFRRVRFLGFLFCFVFIWPQGMQDLPQPGIKPVSLSVEARSLNHWTAREIQFCGLLDIQVKI